MSDAAQQAMQTMHKNLEEKTGKSLREWITIVNQSPLQKHGELVKMLKEDHGLGHGYANMVVHEAKQSHSAATEGEVDWVAEQYKGKESLRPLYDHLMQEVKTFGPDVELSPKKAYVSLRRKKQFAIIQPSTKTRLDIGLNLKGTAPSGKLEAAGSWNAMCTHRIKLEEGAAIDAEIIDALRLAYNQAG